MYHKHLQRQINKYLGADSLSDSRLADLLNAVSESYKNYERDRELSEHAFAVNEAEYHAVNLRLKELAQGLEEKIQLRTKELEEIAQFPLENPNPIYRVSLHGEILFRNTTSAGMKHVIFEGKKFSITAFFKEYIKHVRDHGSFDLTSNDIQYIFYYKKIANKNYINFYGADVTEKNLLRIKAQENYSRLRSFLETTDDGYYIIYASRKEKNFINTQMNHFFGPDLIHSKNLLKEKCKNIISEKPVSVFNKIKDLALGDKLTLQYQIQDYSGKRSLWLNEVVSKQYDVVLDDIVVSGRITDVTQQQEYAASIRESEQRFRSLIDALPVMVWVSDVKNKVIYSNKASAKLLGFEIEKTNSARDFVARIHPDDRKKVMAIWTKNVKARKSYTNEFRVKNRMDSYEYVQETGVPRFDANGKFAGYIGAFFNLSSEKRFQQELQVENSKLDLLTNNSPDIILLINKKGIVEYVSPTTQRILGYKPQEILSHNIRNFICKECKDHLEGQSWLLDLKNGSSKKFEYRMVRKNGDLLWVESLISAIHSGDEEKIIMHNRDIHSIKLAEDVLKESEQKYRGLFENMELGVMEVDLNEKIRWVNRSFEKMCGYSLKYLKGKDAVKLFISDRKTKEIIDQVGEKRKGRSDSLYEIKMKKNKGELLDVVISGSPIIDLNGNVRGSVGIHWNVTELRKIERMLEEEKLSRQKEIMQATLFAEEQQREILGNELHDGVGHILTFTSLFLQMATQSDKLNPELFTKAHQKVEEALNEVRRISRSLIPPALIDLGLKEAIIELFNQFAGMAGFSFDLKCKSQDLQNIDIDAQRNIYRIIQELINNTIKHAKAKKVNLNISRKNGLLQFQYHNDGVPFNPDVVKKGVGLQSINNRVYFYSGKVAIHSTKTKGTSFNIELPLKNIITHE